MACWRSFSSGSSFSSTPGASTHGDPIRPGPRRIGGARSRRRHHGHGSGGRRRQPYDGRRGRPLRDSRAWPRADIRSLAEQPGLLPAVIPEVVLAAWRLALGDPRAQGARHQRSRRGRRHEPPLPKRRRRSSTCAPIVVKSVAGAGENIYRVLQTLPGVAAVNDFDSRLSVRGGGPDQNLTMMDGVEIHNPYRLFGLTSAFNPETVANFELITGGFNAQYGDRLSSILIVDNRPGSTATAIGATAALVDDRRQHRRRRPAAGKRQLVARHRPPHLLRPRRRTDCRRRSAIVCGSAGPRRHTGQARTQVDPVRPEQPREHRRAVRRCRGGRQRQRRVRRRPDLHAERSRRADLLGGDRRSGVQQDHRLLVPESGADRFCGRRAHRRASIEPPGI